ncbi:hypothetical protein NP233_g6339 [Leucocoprinus birnbaumii]|uniref:Uncharacterized protein n=1 Tax=Leucocoprinus birnbaumii TaxID=56174 RepID=A0AAD5VR72_9AGAR|nr:hypothetical protein NP233_g8960 [Leucocoprinus birnbaumii]KAJ3567469.1 hypothetical protein NP233_g6339 [Leucocoprinus birnbaumii]
MYAIRQARSTLQSTLRPTVASSSNVIRYNSTSTMHENDPEVLEREKNRNLSRSQHKTSTPHGKDAPGWNEYLASASEANVKADRSTSSPQDLQEETVKYVKARHVDSEGTENTTAVYTHDTVTGPLSGAKGKEEVQVSESRIFQTEKVHDSPASEIRSKGHPTESEEDVRISQTSK